MLLARDGFHLIRLFAIMNAFSIKISSLRKNFNKQQHFNVASASNVQSLVWNIKLDLKFKFREIADSKKIKFETKTRTN